MATKLLNWDVARTTVFGKPRIQLRGGTHDGKWVTAPVLGSNMMGGYSVSGSTLVGYMTLSLADSTGFADTKGDEYDWPGGKNRPTLRLIQGGKLGKPEVYIKRRPVNGQVKKNERNPK